MQRIFCVVKGLSTAPAERPGARRIRDSSQSVSHAVPRADARMAISGDVCYSHTSHEYHDDYHNNERRCVHCLPLLYARHAAVRYTRVSFFALGPAIREGFRASPAHGGTRGVSR